MGMSATQEFLVLAARLAGTSDYFRWGEVGAAMGYTPQQADALVMSLDARKLLIRLQDGAARILEAGRETAARLDGKLRARGEPARSSRGRPGR